MARRQLTRREFLDVALRHGAAAGMAGGLLPALACSPADVPDAASALRLDESTLALLVDEILPAEDGMPSASEAGLVAYFRRVSVPVPELAGLLDEFVAAAADAAQRRFGSTVGELDRARRVEVLQDLEASDGDRFGAFRNFVYEGYYVNPEIWARLGYEPYPTIEAGPVMDPFDPATLDRVRRLPRLYVEVD
jgi:hypothetical protein